MNNKPENESWGDAVLKWLNSPDTYAERKGLKWETELILIDFMSDAGPIKTPAVHWMIRTSGIGIIGGEIFFVLEHGMVLFRDRSLRDGNDVFAFEPTNLIPIMERYQWGTPPHLYEIANKLSKFSALIDAQVPAYMARQTIIDEIADIQGITVNLDSSSGE